MVGRWKENKKWLSSYFYSCIFNEDYLGIIWNLVLGFIYSAFFISMWNMCNDLSTLTLEQSQIKESITFINIKRFSSYLILYIGITIASNRILNKKILGKRNSLLEILPLKKEDCIKGRFIYILSLNIPLIIFYIWMYSNILNPLLLGLRGVNIIIILMFLFSSSISNITYFTNNRILRSITKVINMSFILLFVASIFALNEKISILFDDFIIFIISGEFTRIIGNFYVGIILGIGALVALYFFNYKYILNGIKGKRWGI